MTKSPKKEFHNLTKLYSIEAMSLPTVEYRDKCEIAGVAEDYEVTAAKYSTPSGVPSTQELWKWEN